MNGMKKLLGVIGILALVAVMLPAQGLADLRGCFSLVTSGVPFPTGCEQGALRHGQQYPNPLDGASVQLDRWIAFSTRSLVPGFEQVRGIYELQNLDQGFARTGELFPLVNDPTAQISYFDPAWSFDAQFLAYCKVNADGTDQRLYVQQFTVSTSAATAATPIGLPVLIVSGSHPRHPHFSAAGYSLTFDDDAAGSIDVYTVDFADADNNQINDNAPVRRTFDNTHAEVAPAWNPVASNAAGRYDIAYATNKFGPFVIEMLDVDLSSGDPAYLKLAEANFNFVSHLNPSWTSDGNAIMYDAPSGEDPSGLTAIWKLDIPTQSKCEIQLDIRADADPYVSRILNHTRNGFPNDVTYNNFLFTTQAGGSGLNVWRGNPVNSCSPALPMGVAISPTTINLNNNSQGSSQITVTLSFPAETKASGYQCQTFNGPNEGVRNRNTTFLSPTIVGIGFPDDPANGSPFGDCHDGTQAGEPVITCYADRRRIAARLAALGLVNQTVPLRTTAYSNRTGRAFLGFGYVNLSSNSTGAASVALLGNAPNPFNPVTRIKFVASKAGTYTLRLYNVQGALVRTLASGRYDVGIHEVAWDGRTNGGGKAASGVYYAKISGDGAEGSDAIRLVLAK
jgi:FlgD Ig-like domain